MLICGIKMTHDAAVVLIDNGKLILSIETEKLNNNPRHSNLVITWSQIDKILHKYGYSLDVVERFAFDGWSSDKNCFIKLNDGDSKSENIHVSLAQYGSVITNEDVLQPSKYYIDALGIEYSSYFHVSGHIFGTYCASPFAERNESSFILVWDGGMPPQLFYYHCDTNYVESLGPLLLLSGYIYINFSHQFKPFSDLEKDMSIAGKAMAYVALGNSQDKLIVEFGRILKEIMVEFNSADVDYNLVEVITQKFLIRTFDYGKENNYNSEDMIASYHHFIQKILLHGVQEKMKANNMYSMNLCFSGGSALNIKWNSTIRNSPTVKELWVSPFTNDSGSALGAACCEMVANGCGKSLNWDVYKGPSLNKVTNIESGWITKHCTIAELAYFLFETSLPIVLLNGRAELGPRALGNRSIIAVATKSDMKDTLNEIKNREHYRPVAPICLEEDAPDVFTPGTADPYMLYEHTVKDSWLDKVPAICHVDNTARLQTVNKSQNPLIYQLLKNYKKLAGIPLLCNTSANLKGSGFFPDVNSAMSWGKVNHIWSDGKLYINQRPPFLAPVRKRQFLNGCE
jgi:carbamoyltransferase